MARVIDTIQVTDLLREHVPQTETPFIGDGLLVILDPFEGTDVSGVDGHKATITRPDGSSFEWVIAGAIVKHGVPALGFANVDGKEVPRLSQITWD